MSPDKSAPKVVNIEAGTWSPEQVARELTRYVDDGEVESIVCAVQFTADHAKEHGFTYDWLGSKQTYQERVYLITWLYQRLMNRLFSNG